MAYISVACGKLMCTAQANSVQRGSDETMILWGFSVLGPFRGVLVIWQVWVGVLRGLALKCPFWVRFTFWDSAEGGPFLGGGVLSRKPQIWFWKVSFCGGPHWWMTMKIMIHEVGGWESINKGALWAGPGSSLRWLALVKIQLEMGILDFKLGLRPGFNSPSLILISFHGLSMFMFSKGHLLGQRLKADLAWFFIGVGLSLICELVEFEPALLACRLCLSPHSTFNRFHLYLHLAQAQPVRAWLD